MTDKPEDTLPAEPTRDSSPGSSRQPDRPAPSPTARARRVSASGAATRPSPKPVPSAAKAGTGAALTKTADAVASAADTDASVATDVEADVGQPDSPAPGRPAEVGAAGHRRAPIWLVAALLVLALALAGALTWIVTANHKSQSQASREKVLAAAKSGAALLLSYNYLHVDADKNAALPHLTGKFATDYATSMNSVIKPQAPKVKAIVEGQIDSAGIESVSPNGKQAVVVVFGQQKVSNTGLTQPRTDVARLRVTMDLVGSTWKISNLSQI